MKRVARAMVAALLFATPVALAESAPRISIIIDDLGYQADAGRRAIGLPGPLAVAILPGTPRAASLARAAHASGKDVLLHLPLQAADPDAPAGADSLTIDMNRAAFGAAFSTALDSVPHVIGISSHRGSLLTRHPGHMTWLMEEIRTRDGLFFVDSYTTPKSIALRMAAEAGIDAVRRDVFLDHEPTLAGIAREFERLKRLARERGIAVGIGHPYSETLEFLEGALPGLSPEGFELISISELLGRQR